ncbi:MAG TPA: site-specific DNA-methyltransferase [Firmicutes bacterium]|nr:site-specific DNA-methyltransferase [Bacillota bacterium]
MDKFNGQSMDMEQAERDKLQALFPQCFSEGKLDIDKLLNLCGEYIDNDFEKYKFEWSGKAECYRLAGKRSTGTLRPCEDESVNWATTRNLYIEGDNLEVLKLLQTAYFRKVKMIYIDPPYNTGNDFVYADDFRDPISRYKEVTQQTTKSNPETMGRYHTNWLNMMFPRLRLAANLLRDDGVIFISIDDNEVHNLRKLCDEVFGEENLVAQMIWHSRQNKDNRNLSGASIDHEYILCYTKQPGWRALRGAERKTEQYKNPDNDPRGSWTSANMVGLATADARPNLHYDLIHPDTGVNYGCPAKGWRYDKNTMKRLIEDDRILWPDSPDGRPRKKAFLDELDDNLPGFSSILEEGLYTNTATKEIMALFNGHWFDFPKPSQLLKRLIAQATDGDDIILDFFSGSATTAHAVMQLNVEDGGNRRYIMVQLPEICDENSEAYKAGYKNICEIGKERIRRAGAKILESSGQVKLGDEDKPPLDVGFRCFKLDTSNLVAWDATPIPDGDLQTLWGRFDALSNTLKAGRSDMDIVFEVMLKMGVPLDFPVLPITVNDKKVYSIGEGTKLLVCLDSGITPEDMEAMCDLAPAKIIAAEEGFVDDTALSNAHYILKDRDIEMKLL